MLTIREVILAKIETTYGLDPGPVAADHSIQVENASWSHEGARMNERRPVRPSRAPLKQAYGGSLVAIEFECELRGPGAAYSATVRPEIDVLLRACGFAVTVVTTAGVETATYAVQSTPSSDESVTIYYFQDGTMRKLTGARGNAEFTLEAGARGMVKFRFVGHDHERGTATAGAASTITLAAGSSAVDDTYNGQKIRIVQGTGKGEENTITDYVGSTKVATVGAWTTTPDNTSVYEIDNGPIDRALPTPAFDTTVAPAVMGASFTIASYAAAISNLAFSPNNAILMPPNVSGADGYGDIRLGTRDVAGSFDPEHTLVATHDWLGRFKAMTTGALATGTIGLTQYNRYAVSMPAVQYREAAPGDRDGIRSLELSFGSVESSGDDDLSIVFS